MQGRSVGQAHTAPLAAGGMQLAGKALHQRPVEVGQGCQQQQEQCRQNLAQMAATGLEQAWPRPRCGRLELLPVRLEFGIGTGIVRLLAPHGEGAA
ncbi:hypothetical protein D3C80_1928010 [compost metagenome]